MDPIGDFMGVGGGGRGGLLQDIIFKTLKGLFQGQNLITDKRGRGGGGR